MTALSERACFPEGEVHWEDPNFQGVMSVPIQEVVTLELPPLTKKEMKKLRRVKDWEEASEKSILGPLREGR